MPTKPITKMPAVPDSFGEALKRVLDGIGLRLDGLACWNRNSGGAILLQVTPVGAKTTDLFTIDRFTARPDGSNWLEGGIELPLRTVTARAMAQPTDFTILCDATAAAFSIFLPQANTCPRRIYAIKKIDASANAVTIDPFGAELIDGAATNVIAAQWDGRILQSTGIGWNILSNI